MNDDAQALRRKMIAAKSALTRINNERKYHYRMYGLDEIYQSLTEIYNVRLQKFQKAERAWMESDENDPSA